MILGNVHNLKIWPAYFQAKVDGVKPWEYRQAMDRTFAVGDRVAFNEFDPETRAYTGRRFGPVLITYVYQPHGDMVIFTHDMPPIDTAELRALVADGEGGK